MSTALPTTNGSLVDFIPAWKRDLILRKRSKAHHHGGLADNEPGGVSPPARRHPGPPTSQQMQLCSLRGGAQLTPNQREDQSSVLSERSNTASPVSSDVTPPNNGIYEKSKIVLSAMKAPPSAMYPKMRLPESPKHPWTEDDEELEYGPGIVSRLKSRYMTIAMREAKSRPSLRKYSSLEDLLDDEGPAWQQERGRSVSKVRPSPGGSPLRREAMKRTRSMDSLALRRIDSSSQDNNNKLPKSVSSGGLRRANLDSLGKENLIIIETTRPSELKNGTTMMMMKVPPMQTVPENPPKSSTSRKGNGEEIPVPALVNQVKKMFEPGSAKCVRGGGTAAKVAAYKSAQFRKNGSTTNNNSSPCKPQLPANKPALKPRPNLTKKITSSGSSCDSENVPGIPGSKKTTRQSSKTILIAKPVNKVGLISPTVGGGGGGSGSTSGLTPITASVTSPCVNGVKKVSPSAISNIRDQSQHQAFDFTSNDSSSSSSSTTTTTSDPHPPSRAHSPPIVPFPPSPTLSPRIQKSSTLTESQRVLEENRKNSDQSKLFSSSSSSSSSKVQPTTTSATTVGKIVGGSSSSATTTESSKKSSSSSSSSLPIVVVVEERPIVITERTSPPVVVGEAVKRVPARSSSSGVQNKETKSAVKVVHPSSSVISGNSESPSSPAIVLKSSTTTNSNKNAPATTTAKSSKGKDKKWHQQENTSLVFNFSKRSDDTPDYIENDGSDFSNRRFSSTNHVDYVIISGYDGKADSSTDDFDDDDITNCESRNATSSATPPPCNVIFEGGAVIINGRSNLQRQPISKKLELSFDMMSTQIFEYPSESSLLEDFVHEDLRTNTSSGGLANYTPSKLEMDDTFELGVSRSAPPPTPPKQKVNPVSDHLRPANETETVTWSEERAPDMLF